MEWASLCCIIFSRCLFRTCSALKVNQLVTFNKIIMISCHAHEQQGDSTLLDCLIALKTRSSKAMKTKLNVAVSRQKKVCIFKGWKTWHGELGTERAGRSQKGIKQFKWEGLGASCPWKQWKLRSCVWRTLWKVLWGTGIFHFPPTSSILSLFWHVFSHLIPYLTTHPRLQPPPQCQRHLNIHLLFPASD